MNSKKLFTINNPLRIRLCESTFISLASRCLSGWQSWLTLVKKKIKLLSQTFARLGAMIGQSANLLRRHQLTLNKRHVVGIVLLMVAVFGVFGHQFFSPYSEDHAVCRVINFSENECKTWCYVNWFYYLFTIRFYVAFIFASVAGILFVPPKYSLSIIPFSLWQTIGWIGIFHYTLTARSFETYHSLPSVGIVVVGIALGFGIVMSADFLLYWENHKKRGNWQKWPAIFRSPLSQEEKNRLYAMADKEYDQVNRMI